MLLFADRLSPPLKHDGVRPQFPLGACALIHPPKEKLPRVTMMVRPRCPRVRWTPMPWLGPALLKRAAQHDKIALTLPRLLVPTLVFLWSLMGMLSALASFARSLVAIVPPSPLAPTMTWLPVLLTVMAPRLLPIQVQVPRGLPLHPLRMLVRVPLNPLLLMVTVRGILPFRASAAIILVMCR